MTMTMKYFIGVIVILFVLLFLSQLAVYMFAGIIMFAGLVAMVESIKPIRWVLARTGGLIDIIIFGGSVMLTWKAGVTVAMGVSIAGLLFTIYYKPYLRNRITNSK